MAIKDEKKRKDAAWHIFRCQDANPSPLNVDVVRVAVECGADLGVHKVVAEYLAHLGRTDPSYPENYSVLTRLFARRPQVPPQVLPQFDHLILFIIDKMSKENIAFVGCELCSACVSYENVSVNCSIVSALLETEKFDANEGFGSRVAPPIFSLMLSTERDENAPSSAVLDCMHLLLTTKGFDVNRQIQGRTITGPKGLHILEYVTHPEIAKVLIRNGANVNAISTSADGLSSNALSFAVMQPHNPHLEELVRLYIAHGSELLADGTDRKSSSTMRDIFHGMIHPTTKKRVHVSEEVLHLFLQLNNKKNLRMRWQSVGFYDWTFLNLAVRFSPPRFVEIVYAQNPEALKERIDTSGSRLLSAVEVLSERIEAVETANEFNDCMKVLEILLDDDSLKLCDVDRYDEKSHYGMLTDATRKAKQDLMLLNDTITEKRGEEASYDYWEVFKKSFPDKSIIEQLESC